MPRLTLPRGSRLTRHRDVRRPFDHGASGAAGRVVVYAFGRGDTLPPRYALVVGRKWGDAPTRNRVRRLLRESFRTGRPDLPAGFDYVLLPRGPLQSHKMPDVRDDLVRAARSAARRFAAEGGPRPRPAASDPAASDPAASDPAASDREASDREESDREESAGAQAPG